MPAVLTELRKNYRTIAVKMDRVMNNRNLKEELGELYDALSDLYALTDNFLSPDEDGNYMIPDEGSLRLLKESYLRCFGLAGTRLNEAAYESERTRDNIAELSAIVMGVLKKDYLAIDAAKPEDNLPLAEIIGKAVSKEDDKHYIYDQTLRTGVDNPPPIKIEINANEKLGIVKGGVSSRIPVSFMKDGREVKGFFTKYTHVNGLEKAKKVFDDYCDKFPRWQDEFTKIYEYVSQDLNAFVRVNDPVELSKAGVSSERQSELNNDKDFAEKLKELWDKFRQEVSVDNLLYIQNQKMDKDAVFESRSVVIEKMGQLLGVSRVIAPTANMQVKIGDELLDGIFMETVEGVNNNICKGKALKKDVFDGEALRDISDIQIMDYLSNNIDRHTDNFLCVFSDVDDPKVKRVIAIDNDNSFGDENYKGSYGVLLKDIVIISEQTADKILNMDPEALRRTLDGQGLPKIECDYALDRFARLREALVNGKIEIIKDNEWKNLTLKAVCNKMKTNTNIYDRIAEDFEDNFELGEEKGKTDKISPREFNYNKAELRDEFPVETVMKDLQKNRENEVMTNLADGIKEALEKGETIPKSDKDIIYNGYKAIEDSINKLFNSDSRFIRSSKEFRTMKSEAIVVLSRIQEVRERIEAGTFDIKDKNLLTINTLDLKNAALAYKRYKLNKLKGSAPNDYELGRLSASDGVIDAIDQLIKNMSYESNTVNVIKDDAKPEEKMYDKLDAYCKEIGKVNVSEEDFKRSLAGIIYFNGVRKNIVKIKNDKNINNIFFDRNIDENIEKITKTQGFAELMSGDIATLKEKIAADRGDSVFKEYVQKEAKYTRVRTHNVHARRSPKEIVRKSNR